MALVGALACFQASAAFMFPSAPKAPMVSLQTARFALYTFTTNSTMQSAQICMAAGCYDLGASRSKPREGLEGCMCISVANHDLSRIVL